MNLSEDAMIQILRQLDNVATLNLILALKFAFCVFCGSQEILRKFKLKINCSNFKQRFESEIFKNVQFKNISINMEGTTKFEDVLKFFKRFKNSLEILEIKNLKFKNFEECRKLFTSFKNLKSLELNKCYVECLSNEKLDLIRTLKSISFNKCSDNIFKIFKNQESFEKITVINKDWSWNGFPHDVFNEICKNCKNLDHLVLLGAGTGSFMDSDEFPFKITKLETSMISFNWYVGIKSARVNFLESQKGHLKELTIHELPYDFDGGKVLKYIIEEMNLDTLYYGEIPLILNGQKQKVHEFKASEIQITSAYEMIKQFSCEKFTLELSSTDISSDAIESIINKPTNIFDNIKEFVIIDKSSYRGTFGVYLGLYVNLRNIERLTFITQDRNINTILECLPTLYNLKEFSLNSTATRALERYKTILKLAPNLEKISIAKQSLEDAAEVFKSRNVKIFDIETSECLKDFTAEVMNLENCEENTQTKKLEQTELTNVAHITNITSYNIEEKKVVSDITTCQPLMFNEAAQERQQLVVLTQCFANFTNGELLCHQNFQMYSKMYYGTPNLCGLLFQGLKILSTIVLPNNISNSTISFKAKEDDHSGNYWQMIIMMSRSFSRR